MIVVCYDCVIYVICYIYANIDDVLCTSLNKSSVLFCSVHKFVTTHSLISIPTISLLLFDTFILSKRIMYRLIAPISLDRAIKCEYRGAIYMTVLSYFLKLVSKHYDCLFVGLICPFVRYRYAQ